MGYIFCSHLVFFLKKVYETKLHFLIFFSRNMYCVISKKEKKLYFALESTPASHLFPTKSSSKRLVWRKRWSWGRVRRERERRDSACGCVCLFVWVYVCLRVYSCLCVFGGSKERDQVRGRIQLGLSLFRSLHYDGNPHVAALTMGFRSPAEEV